jgi:hypothetical protein
VLESAHQPSHGQQCSVHTELLLLKMPPPEAGPPLATFDDTLEVRSVTVATSGTFI